MYLIPYRQPFSGRDVLFDLENVVEGIFITAFFIFFIFLFMPKKKGWFLSIMRVFIGLETVSLAAPLTFFFTGKVLIVFVAFFVAWYLALAAWVYSRLAGTSYLKGGLIAMICYHLSQMMPMLLGG